MTYTLFLIPLGLLPTIFGITGIISGAVAVLCAILFLAQTFKLFKDYFELNGEFKKNLDKLPSSLKIYHSAVWSKKAYQIKEEKEHQRHPNKEGECDFVLVDQDLGAVFIEVKGGTIKRDEKNTCSIIHNISCCLWRRWWWR